MAHKICVFECPVCSKQRVISDSEKVCMTDCRCKSCSNVSKLKEHQECFEFR